MLTSVTITISRWSHSAGSPEDAEEEEEEASAVDVAGKTSVVVLVVVVGTSVLCDASRAGAYSPKHAGESSIAAPNRGKQRRLVSIKLQCSGISHRPTLAG